jgi:hypothetical protein
MNENMDEELLARQTTFQVSDNNTEIEQIPDDRESQSPSIYQPSGSIAQIPTEVKFPTPTNEKTKV